jgi:hypothetical protein
VKSEKSSSVLRESGPTSARPESEPISAPRRTEAMGPMGGADGGADKIRGLLFGNQMQDHNRRLCEMEERFLQRFKDLESETMRSLSRFESNTKKHLDSLASQFREEKDQSAAADKENERDRREQGQAMEKSIWQLFDQASELDREIADRVVRETQALHDDIKQKSADLRSTIEKIFAEVSNVKTDRSLLAGLFIEVAKCLNQDIGNRKGAGNQLHGVSG